MSALFKKLNLGERPRILVLNAPASFETELAALSGVTIVRDAKRVRNIDFMLAFVITRRELDAAAKLAARKTEGDAVVWFAFPKGTSRNYTCEFNRDTGWVELGAAGFEAVRIVAIDDDWSALRFRRVEFIKNMTRESKRALTRAGKTRTSGR